MSYQSPIPLDPDQRAATEVRSNAVVTAGAGSGKTSVLAARYAWLVMERGFPVERILTLTFTNKAVNEMYSRIYRLLSEQADNPLARTAVRDFHKARISTLDSFCAAVARLAAPRFGIAPDFKSDNGRLRELALEAAVPFVLDHRENPALQVLLADRRIKTVAEELFAKTVLEYSPISSPLDFNVLRDRQRREILEQWQFKTRDAAICTGEIERDLGELGGNSSATCQKLARVFQGEIPEAPGIAPLLEGAGDGKPLREGMARYFRFLASLCAINIPWNAKALVLIRENQLHLKKVLHRELRSIANAALQWEIVQGVFPLVEEFQRSFNRKKRETGLLTFHDVAVLALDTLSRYPDIRRIYKDETDAVMIDEFQDNNSLQRDLIFLLAEKPERTAVGLPGPDELCPDKMFFVGDEKQSIYRFRGADVSVFRSLGDNGALSSSLNLGYNYRSSPALVAAFNYLFGGLSPHSPPEGSPEAPGVFLPDRREIPAYEARYTRLKTPGPAGGGEGVPLHFCFLDEGRILPPGDPEWLSPYDLEAAFIAATIRKLVDSGYPIRNRREGGQRPCTYGDVAILQRSTSHQNSLERSCKDFGIPCNAENPRGLFSDGPINDMYAFLRLMVYPEDRTSYAAVIRSPFARLSDLVMTHCLLSSAPPFDPSLEGLLPEADRDRFRQAASFYRDMAEAARTLSSAELVTRLWYGAGYRYETLWSPEAQHYGELYDYFFELARRCDGAGKTPAEFLDYIEDFISREEKVELDIPIEREIGVRIMTIHKSKGLEFPVVFLYGCGNRAQNIANTETIYYSGHWGLTINLPQAEELPGEDSGNYFFNMQRDEEIRRETAELRRLLYVAMTRAESALFVSASVPLPGEGGASLEEQLGLLKGKLDKKIEEYAADGKTPLPTFLELLLPVLSRPGQGGLYSLERIPVLTRRELRRLAKRAPAVSPSLGQVLARAEPCYDGAGLLRTEPALSRLNASSLHLPPEDPAGETADGEGAAGESANGLNRKLKKAGLSPEDFGTLVHAVIEARFKGLDPLIPPRIMPGLNDEELALELARERAESFFASELGKRCMEAEYRESEFPFLTLVCGGRITISGQIDLLFESGGKIHVVDFKTDQTEDIRRHLAQLAVYCRAIGDIFGKETVPWLFYLRGGREINLEGKLEGIDIDRLAAEEADRYRAGLNAHDIIL
ncbi:MAG: UvrD-helicase domain-containing protein [Spirochaetaceae bacterium]|jgi:ATP-dependent helicase/nuclease subunit A|nr:UvrD-helicase domain-containing protein [Spirochaetaceae bacterium]